MRVRPLFASILMAALVLAASVTLVSAAAGQIFVVKLTPSGDPDGRGIAVIRLDPANDRVCYTINVRRIGVPTEPAAGLGAAHIHDFATGGIFVDLETNWVGGAKASTTTGCAEATEAQLTALATSPSAYYVNIHTVQAPGGAIQGTLG